jgi:hypothetical protein
VADADHLAWDQFAITIVPRLGKATDAPKRGRFCREAFRAIDEDP